MLKKSNYWHLYLLENLWKAAIFFGFTTHRKKRREGRKKNLLLKEDKIVIFAVFVVEELCLFETLISRMMKKKKWRKNEIHFCLFCGENLSLKNLLRSCTARVA